MKKTFATASVIMLLIAAGTAIAALPTLKVGDAAPPMKIAKWVKGKPVTSFAKGKVYVVEFWATWCGPCKQSIPHLTELAKKYKDKVTFSGISVWEHQADEKDTAYMAAVDKFVKDMGDNMNYNVGIDGPEKTMAKTWMMAAGENGIPSAFVIGKDGKIAWIGHPMGDLDQVLEKVLAGKWDAKTFGANRSAEKAEAEKMTTAFAKMEELVKNKQPKEALAEMDKVLAANPEWEQTMAYRKFSMMVEVDDPQVYTYAQKIAGSYYKDSARALLFISSAIVEDNPKLKTPDYKIGLTISEQAAKLSENKDPYILNTLSFAQFKNGKVDEAIATQEQAIKLLEADKSTPEQTMTFLKTRLDMFKTKQTGS
jgi:thiol-disulfide isomerase/thioredoxin